MKPPPFLYYDPTEISEALALLAKFENARPLAGGQSLMPMLNMRYAQPDHLIDLRRIAELAFLEESDGAIRFGAMTRQREIEFSPLVRARLPLMAEAIQWIGHRQTRNRGTIGGSLCHLDPAAELMTIAAAHDARFTVQGADGRKMVDAADWALGYMTPAVAPDELLHSVAFTPWPAGHGAAFVEFSRRHGDFAIASAAVLMTLDAAGKIDRVALAIGGVGPAPLRMGAVEQALLGQTGSPEIFAQAGRECALIEASGDALVPAEYRAHLAGVMAKRALASAHAKALSPLTRMAAPA